MVNKPYTSSFTALLSYQNPHLVTPGDAPGPLEILKAKICDSWTIYVQRYQEEVRPRPSHAWPAGPA